MRSIRSIALVLVSVIGVGMLCVPATATSARLVWNFTPSIPTGLYTIEDRVWRRGDHVAVEPSGDLQVTLQKYGVLKGGRLLMKRVAASEGDSVCRTGQQVTINGVASVTARSNKELPSWSGCIHLKAGNVFLLGDSEKSFDGRYFGITEADDIIGPIRPIFKL